MKHLVSTLCHSAVLLHKHNYLFQIDKCPPAYSFRNEMSLRPSLETFENTLNDLHVSSNVDYPEGGFEALLQVASCDNRIGRWNIMINVALGSAVL